MKESSCNETTLIKPVFIPSGVTGFDGIRLSGGKHVQGVVGLLKKRQKHKCKQWWLCSRLCSSCL